MFEDKAKHFLQLHSEGNRFVIPNPWDLGSAKLYQGMGFKAVATTSYGLAFTLGRKDGAVSKKETFDHCRMLASNLDISVSADFENGFSEDPGIAASNVVQLMETGVAGCSIEDYDPDQDKIYDLNHAVDKVAATVERVKIINPDFVITARAENYFRGVTDLEDTIQRLVAFEKAGADVLYAPGLPDIESVKAVKGSLAKPINVLGPYVANVSLNEMFAAGATRISLGGAQCLKSIESMMVFGEQLLQGDKLDFSELGRVKGKLSDYL